jgi:DNA-binding transcriptional ArsR family regulator
MTDARIRQLKADLLKALGQPTRLKILELLADGERCVCEIFPAIGGEQSNVSKHLGFLRSQGIVVADRRGMRVFYRLSDRKIAKLLDEAEDCVKGTLRSRFSDVA